MTCVSAEDSNNTDTSLKEQDSLNLQNADESAVLKASNNNKTNEAESQCYLILDNDADKENIYVGDYVTWIVSVINMGPDTAKNVNVYDELPDGLKYISHTLSKGVFNPETGIWSIGNLSIKDGEVFLNITTKALSVGEKINKATLTTDSYNLNENESYEEEEIDVFEHEDADKSIASLKATGNPIALVLLSLFAIFVTSRYKF